MLTEPLLRFQPSSLSLHTVALCHDFRLYRHRLRPNEPEEVLGLRSISYTTMMFFYGVSQNLRVQIPTHNQTGVRSKSLKSNT